MTRGVWTEQPVGAGVEHKTRIHTLLFRQREYKKERPVDLNFSVEQEIVGGKQSRNPTRAQLRLIRLKPSFSTLEDQHPILRMKASEK